MKVLIGAVAATLLMGGMALAQPTTTTTTTATTTAPAAAPVVAPSACPTLADPPTAPDPATATRDQMQVAVAAYEAWRPQAQAVIDCRRPEVDNARATSEARTAEWNRMAPVVRDTAQSFASATAAFAARTNRRPRGGN